MLREIRTVDVRTGARVRKDYGDIAGLAASIEDVGLLQPIGITAENLLIFGERRLLAFRHLGRATIPARVVEIDSVLRGEHAENEFRKDWTVSERVAIGRALEAELGERRGRPESIPDNCPELGGEETRDIAARATGFGSGKTYERAKQVVDEGAPELVAAVDRGEVAVSAAAQVAALPREVQADIVATGPEEVREVAKTLRAHVANNSGNNEWYTPPSYIAAARETMGRIDVDPASSEIANRTVQAAAYFDAERDGLKQAWPGAVWMNPPYAQPLIAEFCGALADKYAAGEVEQACVLVNNGTETGWFQTLLAHAAAVCLVKSRIKFIDPEGQPSGAPLQGQAVVYLGQAKDRFAEAFGGFGKVLFA